MESLTRNGVAAGKNDRENEGGTTVIYDDYTLGTYDDAADGAGNAFDPRDVYGFGRIGIVNVQVHGDHGYIAKYDYDNNSIRVYAQANDGTGTAEDALVEVGAGTVLNIDLRMEIRGTGP